MAFRISVSAIASTSSTDFAVTGELILDTGPFVALIDRSETTHEACVEALESWTGPILTTEAVLTEALRLLGPTSPPRRACVSFILRGTVLLVPASVPALRRATELMEKYEDIPMDYADATVVALAEEVGTDQVFTLNRRNFTMFRHHGTRSFRLLP